MKKLITFIWLCFIYCNTYANPLSLNFNDIPIRQALQFIAEANHTNIIISDAVKGNITLHIENLAPEKALDIIMQEAGLGKQTQGNVLLILPLQELAQQEKIQQDMQNFSPLHSFLLTLHYAKATDIANSIKTNNLLSSRGSMNVDARTNTVWFQDTSLKINAIRSFVKIVDRPVKQVLIEARIVSIDENYERELGVKFQALPTQQEGAKGQFSVDLPVENPKGATIGITLAKLAKGNLLDLELSALETEGAGEIISSPRIVTANQQPASILAGQEVPYQQSTTSGATSVSFQKAVLNLTVTPQITPDKHMVLNLLLSQDRPTTTLIRGVPIIDTRQLQTLVTVKNGQTVVLGGIYEQNEQKNVEEVPFISKIPFLGALFRHSLTKNDRRELLIFITPSIIDD